MFVAPLSVTEYIVAHLLSALVKTCVIFCGISAVAAWGFHFDVLRLGVLNVVLFFVNLTVFAWSVGLVLLGVIFQVGTRIQALAWGMIFLFQPLTAAFFPVSALPPALRAVAYALPPTYVFEAARRALDVPGVNWAAIAIAGAENLAYLVLAVGLFSWMVARSRSSGRLARAEG
jgi:ABC-2 type transport system permease protein